ncbi:MAG: hypothetical protein QXT26_00695 [Thermoproteota archaeon]
MGGERIFKTGVLDVKEKIKKVRESQGPRDSEYKRKLAELEVMEIVLDVVLVYAKRYSEKLRKWFMKRKTLPEKRNYCEYQQCYKAPA